MRVDVATATDHAAIRSLFRATVALGRPLPFASTAPELMAAYAHLCLDWYLDPAAPTVAGLLRDGTTVRGYALVALTGPAPAELRSAMVRFAVAAARVSTWRVPAARAFVLDRLRDAWALRRRPPSLHGLPHAHVNAVGGHLGLPGRALADFVDEVVRAAGHDRWYGEINAPVGRRALPITRRWGADLVRRAPNHTLTRLAGAPVERLTIVRTVPPAQGRSAA